MRGAGKKLKNKRGETLVESLVAILVLSLTSVLFLTLINTSVRITKSANEHIQGIYSQELSAAENQSGVPASGSVTLSVDYGAGPENIDIPVSIYGGEGALKSYKGGGI